MSDQTRHQSLFEEDYLVRELGLVSTSKIVGDESRSCGQVRAITYGTLVSTANLRLMRLQKTLEDRYENLTQDHATLQTIANSI